ncbi:hypothetical protein HMPREF1861_00036 [Corynebacterium kroppenstedtii]|nr:hypothetical protein HMPREF1861_00036 [Corynebacterium kroppenstedtii]
MRIIPEKSSQFTHMTMTRTAMVPRPGRNPKLYAQSLTYPTPVYVN